MLDLGLDVLFKGKNLARLLGGLGVALKISATSVLISLPLGILLGPFVGAAIGELCHNREDISKVFLVGFGSFLSFIVGTGLKLIAAVGMFVHISADTYPVVREWFASIS